MKLQCNREKLLHAFQMAAGVAPTRRAKEIEQVINKHVPEARVSYNSDQQVMDCCRTART